jgi:hypothetical protein
MAKTTIYRIMCHIPGTHIETKIEARELTVKDGAYQFWTGEYGETNRLIASYPVGFTVIETEEPAPEETDYKPGY